MSNRSPVITLLAIAALAVVIVGLNVTTTSQTATPPPAAEPAAGPAITQAPTGAPASALVGLWLTSSFWFFTTVGVTL
ncbi:MAG: hypothetical protein ACRDRY_23880 [Pseudonocardiaceae bacterium]